MPAHNYSLDFIGYKLEGREDTFEHASGIYCVYACTYNAVRDTVSLRKLLYVGKAEDLHERHQNHEGKANWRMELLQGEMLCYSRAHLPASDLDVCEAALIYRHQPVCNTDGKESFNHRQTHVATIGRNAWLEPDFTVG